MRYPSQSCCKIHNTVYTTVGQNTEREQHMELKDKGVLVTGGASGLGAACVRLLTQSGAKAVIADLNSELGNALASELGSATAFVQTNVTDEASVQAAVDAALKNFGGLHILINCAG